MPITVGTQWDISLLEQLIKLNKEISDQDNRIDEIYGAMPNDIIGSAREDFRLKNVTWEKFKEQVDFAIKNNIEVNYLFNRLAITPSFISKNKDKIRLFAKKIINVGVTRFTISSPQLAIFFINEFPDAKIDLSTICGVSSIQQAKFFTDIGIKRIKLDLDVNRNFDLLSNLVKMVGCEFELLLNECCLFNCPLKIHHLSIQGLKSKEFNKKNIEEYAYPYALCGEMILDEENFPYQFLKSRWIRPEDMKIYKNMGIKYFKVTGRTMGASWISDTTKAYAFEKYSGNFLDLFPIVYSNIVNEGKENIGKYIENAKLEGFINYFIEKKPDCDTDCEISCSYCYNFSKKYRLKKRE